MSGIGQFGLGAAGMLLGTGLEDRREKRQHENQKDLMSWQKANQMGLNEQAHDLQFKMWEKTNYPAQMAMLKEAGLSPGLMYGMGGTGGATTGSVGGGGAAGGQATKGNTMDIANMAMLGAQKDLIKAQTKKTEAEAENISGVDRELKGMQAKIK